MDTVSQKISCKHAYDGFAASYRRHGIGALRCKHLRSRLVSGADRARVMMMPHAGWRSDTYSERKLGNNTLQRRYSRVHYPARYPCRAAHVTAL